MSVAGHHLPIWFDEATGPTAGQGVFWNATTGRFEAAAVDISALDTAGLATDAALTAGLATKEPTIPPGTYVQASGVSETTTYSVEWQVTAVGTSGIRGLKLNRSATGRPLGVTLQSAGVSIWDTAALDATTTNIVLAYSYLKASGTADMIRGDVESHWTISDTAGVPDPAFRLNLESTAADAATTAVMLRLSVAAGSPVNAAGKYLVQAMVNGVRVWDVTREGYASFGAVYNTKISGGGVESKKAITVWNTDADAFIYLQRIGTSTQNWVVGIDSASSNQFVIKENASGRCPIKIRPTAADITLYADTNGAIFGAAAQKIGFGGTTPITKPTATPPIATDLDTALTLLNYLRTNVVLAYGLAS